MRKREPLGYYDRELDEQCGYRDATAGKPRESTRVAYRAGYNRGLTEVCKGIAAGEPDPFVTRNSA